MRPEEKTTKKGKHTVLKAVLFALLGLWVVVLIALQVVLNSKVLTRIVNDIASEYVDGDISFGKIKASVFKSFPNLNLTLDDFSLTYPHDRFAEFDSVGIDSRINPLGRNEMADTLASFRNLSISVNYVSLIFGKINIPNAELKKPRIFAHQYNSLTANWNMFILSSEEKEDDSFDLPPIVIGHIGLSDHPEVYYTNPTDTLFAALQMDNLAFKGRIATKNASKNKLKIGMNGLYVAGRLPADTVTFSMDRFLIDEHKDHMDIEAEASAKLFTNSFGRMDIPFALSGELSFRESEGIALSVRELDMDVATVCMKGEADVEVLDSIYVKGNLGITDCSISNLIDFFGDNFPTLKKVSTNAKLTAGLTADGWYNPSRPSYPAISAYVNLPESSISYDDFEKDGLLSLELTAQTDDHAQLGADLKNLSFSLAGIDFSLKGTARDLLGEDPLFTPNGEGKIILSDAMSLLPEDLEITAEGDISASIDGSIHLSELTPYNFSNADLKAELRSSLIRIDDPADSISAFLLKPSIVMDNGITVALDSLSANIYDMQAGATSASFFIKNAIEQMADDPSRHPLMGDLDIQSINIRLDQETVAGIRNTCNIFTFTQKRSKNIFTPLLSFTTDNDNIFVHSGVNRITLDDASFKVSAAMHTFETGQKRKHAVDSLRKAHPGVPKDQLLARERRGRPVREIPEYLQEKDFKAKDLNLQLSESLAKYYREWDLRGNLDIKNGLVITPYFPLKNELRDIRGSFTNDEVKLSNFTFAPGESDLSASGTLSSLRRALLNNGKIGLKLDISSDNINANELLGAYDLGAKYTVPSSTNTGNLNDEQYLAKVAVDTLSNTTVSDMSLIVIPSNIDASVTLQCNSIKYSNLDINWLAADVNMKERCLQITNTVATTNMGDLYLEAFYSTKTKRNIAAGFDLTMSEISAGQVIDLFPAVDTLMPMIKAFNGLLDCEMAVTTQIDTNMNFIIPSISGIVKIGGQELSLEETGPIKTLAKILMFRNKKTGYIDDMTVNGIIKDNKLEVFPFVLKIDRYTLAMGGLQDLENDFQYHISVLKSPIPFRFGINLFGNFDNWKWRIGRAKYKSANLPVFNAQVESLKDQLVNSIHNIYSKGVDRALADNEAAQQTIADKKIELGYDPTAPMDSLDTSELAQLDSLQRDFENPVDSLMNARIDSLWAVAAQKETTANEVIDEYEGSKIQEIIDQKFEKQEAKDEAKASRKAARQARREQRQSRRKARREARADARKGVLSDTILLSLNSEKASSMRASTRVALNKNNISKQNNLTFFANSHGQSGLS